MHATDELIAFAPIIIILTAFLLQNKIVITPAQLEQKHRAIMDEVNARFVTKDAYNDLREDFTYIKEKIDKIYQMMSIS